MTGCLFLVVGPSGAGKDTLLDLAKEHLGDNANVYFPQRYITRKIDAGGEAHIAVSDSEFELLKSQDQFAFLWDAHNLKYGVPRHIDAYLNNGSNVVVNVSRSIIADACERYSDVCVISITVNPEELERRLRNRGRENPEDISNRLKRAQAFKVEGPHVVEIDNSEDLKQSANAFIAEISSTNRMKKPA